MSLAIVSGGCDRRIPRRCDGPMIKKIVVYIAKKLGTLILTVILGKLQVPKGTEKNERN